QDDMRQVGPHDGMAVARMAVERRPGLRPSRAGLILDGQVLAGHLGKVGLLQASGDVALAARIEGNDVVHRPVGEGERRASAEREGGDSRHEDRFPKSHAYPSLYGTSSRRSFTHAG